HSCRYCNYRNYDYKGLTKIITVITLLSWTPKSEGLEGRQNRPERQSRKSFKFASRTPSAPNTSRPQSAPIYRWPNGCGTDSTKPLKGNPRGIKAEGRGFDPVH